MKATAQQEHAWLQQLVGSWSFTSTCNMGPDTPPSTSTGKARIRALGDLWILVEGQFEMEPGKMETSIITLGYDPKKKAFVGTFVASMMSMLWQYEGQLDANKRILTLDAEGPSMMGEGNVKYHDIIEIVDKNKHLFRSEMQMPDGSWKQFMDATYTRE